MAEMAPHAAPDLVTALLLDGTIAILLRRPVGQPLLAGGGVLGLWRRRWRADTRGCRRVRLKPP
jgi:hypothetical protein